MTAAAMVLPPFCPSAAIEGTELSCSLSLDSAAPTKPTGTPTTASGCKLPSSTISKTLKMDVGAFPKTNSFGPSTLAAYSTAAMERVIPFSLAS